MSAQVRTEEYPTTRETQLGTPSTRSTRGFRVGLGGLALAVMLSALGLVMKSNADFAERNVRDQLAEQRITFKPAQALSPEERGTPCLVRYAGDLLTTGQQAECYANHFIGRHLKSVAGGKTYAEMREVQTSLRAQIEQAQARNDPAVPELQRQLAEANAKRQTLMEGESMRGLLLTSYGFSTLGTRADQAATVAFVAAGAALLLSLAVLVRSVTRRSPA